VISPAAARATHLHASLTRPILLGGAEREPVIVEATSIVALTFAVGLHLPTAIIALLLGTVGHSLLRRAAKEDPQMMRVYTRHVRYKTYYPAQASLTAPDPVVLPFAFDIR